MGWITQLYDLIVSRILPETLDANKEQNPNERKFREVTSGHPTEKVLEVSG